MITHALSLPLSIIAISILMAVNIKYNDRFTHTNILSDSLIKTLQSDEADKAFIQKILFRFKNNRLIDVDLNAYGKNTYKLDNIDRYYKIRNESGKINLLFFDKNLTKDLLKFLFDEHITIEEIDRLISYISNKDAPNIQLWLYEYNHLAAIKNFDLFDYFTVYSNQKTIHLPSTDNEIIDFLKQNSTKFQEGSRGNIITISTFSSQSSGRDFIVKLDFFSKNYLILATRKRLLSYTEIGSLEAIANQ